MKKTKGSALVVALFVCSLAVIVSTAMFSSEALHIRRVTNILDGDQAYLYTLALEDTVKHNLLEDLKSKKSSGVDHLEENWAKKIEKTDAPTGAKLVATVKDLHSCFNLNNVIGVGRDAKRSKIHLDMFKQLMRQQGFEENDSAVYALIDWIDTNFDPESGGAEDSDYLEAKPAYRTANQLMIHPSELRLVKGFNSDVMRKIEAEICALPESSTKINVNTATIPILMALAPGISKEDAEFLIEHRKAERKDKEEKAYSKIGDFLSVSKKSKTVSDKLIDVKSKYFLVTSEAKVGRGKSKLVSLLKREKGTIKVLWRSWGE